MQQHSNEKKGAQSAMLNFKGKLGDLRRGSVVKDEVPV
jgi:hypothetical protein